MKRVLIASVIVFVLMITFASVCVSQMAEKGWEKTVTAPNGEVILEMNGEWDCLHEFPGMKGFTIVSEITQKDKTFMGIRLQEFPYWPKGTEAIKGELQGDGFKAVSINRADLGWTPCKWEISKNGNKILLNDEGVVKLTLIRR
jgi:hypothetical protein